jgi:branched-chain amino acid transport system substrate-binding protein
MRRLGTALIALMTLGLVAVLSGQSAAAAEPTCGLHNGKKATGEPIPLGSITGRTGPTDFSSSSEAAGAYFKCVNDNGGINGRPIDFTIEDDAWKPEQAAAAAAKLVNDRKVYALVGNSSFVDCSANEALYEKEDVLVVAGVGIPRDCFFSKNYSSTNGGRGSPISARPSTWSRSST